MTGLRRHRLKQAEIFLKLGEHQHYDGSVFASGARASKRSCGKGGHGATERAKKRHLTTAGGKSGGKYYCGTKKSSNFNCGEMPEWSNGAVSKTVVLSRVPRVRIPVSPPIPLLVFTLFSAVNRSVYAGHDFFCHQLHGSFGKFFVDPVHPGVDQFTKIADGFVEC